MTIPLDNIQQNANLLLLNALSPSSYDLILNNIMINARINSPTHKTLNIQFPERQAKAVVATYQTRGSSLPADLGLDGVNSFVLITGSAQDFAPEIQDRLKRLFNMGIVPAVVSSNSVVIDGATNGGIMKLLGQSLTDRNPDTPLIGFAPKDKVDFEITGNADKTPLEPHHTHFVLTPGDDFGGETRLMFEFAEALLSGEQADAPVYRLQFWKKPAQTAKVKGVCLVIGGGDVARREVARAVQLNLSVIVVSGSGGLADEITAAYKTRSSIPSDPLLAQIITDGELHFHELTKPEKGIERLIIRELGLDSVLLQAWESYADYDYNAGLQQKRHRHIQIAIILLGIISATLAVYWKNAGLDEKLKSKDTWATVMHTLLILSPIVTTLMLAAANKFKSGNKWLLLRGGAESLKREIYAYRTKSGEYAKNPEHVLAQRMEKITRRTMRTEVNLSAVKPASRGNGFPATNLGAQGDDGFSELNPDKYIQYRLKDQLNFYRSAAVKIDRKLRMLYWGSFITAGLSTFLAVTENQVWIAVTTAVVAAIGTYLAFTQYEMTLVKYNQSKTDLLSIMAWWNALSAEQQARPQNFTNLVNHTEMVLKNEFEGWIQQMEDTLDQLTHEQEKSTSTSSDHAATTADLLSPKDELIKNGLHKNGSAKLHKNGQANGVHV